MGITHGSPRKEREESKAILQAIDSDLNDNEFLLAFLGRPHCPNRGQGGRGVQVYQQTSVGFLQNPHAIDDRPDFCDTLEHIARVQDCSGVAGIRVAIGSAGDQSPRHPLGILFSWRHISKRLPNNKHCFLNGSQQSLICNPRGLSCFIVRRPERTSC